MIGLVLVTHGGLAYEFVAAVEHIVGPQERMLAISIGPDDDIEDRKSEIIKATTDVDEGDGVIVLTDMFGGTPSNLAISLLGFLKIMNKLVKKDFLVKQQLNKLLLFFLD